MVQSQFSITESTVSNQGSFVIAVNFVLNITSNLLLSHFTRVPFEHNPVLYEPLRSKDKIIFVRDKTFFFLFSKLFL